jgi:hypothetical protein
MMRGPRQPSHGLYGSPRGVVLVVLIGAGVLAGGFLISAVMTWIMT